MTSHTTPTFFPDFLPRSPSLERELQPRMRVGDFELVAWLDDGGAGVVWRALQQRGGEEHEVVVKFANLPVSEGGDLSAEIELLGGLESNAGTIHILGAGSIEVDGHEFQWFAMPLLERPLMSLRAAPVKKKLQVFVDACDIVQQIHDRTLIHRDLKPKHFFLNDHDRPVIIDFGIATVNAAADELHACVGTPQYMPRELFLQPTAPHGRQDVYALGVILLELLVGEQPYDLPKPDKRKPGSAFEKISEFWRNTDTNLKPNGIDRVPAGLRKIVRRAVDPDPKRRFTRVRDLRDAIVAYQRRWLRRQKVAIALGVVVLGAWGWLGEVATSDLSQRMKDFSTRLGGIIGDSVRVGGPARDAFGTDQRLRETLDSSERLIFEYAEEHPDDEDALHADAVVADGMGYLHYLNENWDAARHFFTRAIRRGRMLTDGWPDDPLHRENLIRALLRSASTERADGKLPFANAQLAAAYDAITKAALVCGRDWLKRNSGLLDQLAHMHRDHANWDRAHALFVEMTGVLPDLAEADRQGVSDWILIEFLMIDCAEKSRRAEQYDVSAHEQVLTEALKRWDEIDPEPSDDVEFVRRWLAARK